jgi:hypothetical protein
MRSIQFTITLVGVEAKNSESDKTIISLLIVSHYKRTLPEEEEYELIINYHTRLHSDEKIRIDIYIESNETPVPAALAEDLNGLPLAEVHFEAPPPEPE